MDFTRITVTLLCVLSFALFDMSCTQRRQDEKQNSNQTSTTEDYQYPHPSNWSALHVEFYAKNSKKIDGTTKDCNRCHLQREKGQALNVSCTTTCHAPRTESALGDIRVVNASKANSGGSECLTCHANVIKKSKSHYPAHAGLCKSCHDASAEHVTGTNKKAVTTQSTEQSCHMCHYRVDNHQIVHEGLKQKEGCSSCHDPHGSDHSYFLKKDTASLCIDCHKGIHLDNKSVHGVIRSKQACLSCHKPHSGDEKKLLTKKSDQLCFSCHDNIKQKVTDSVSVHSPAAKPDECNNCHKVHDSEQDKLLSENFSIGEYNRYFEGDDKTPNTYALCFQCHETSMLKKDISSDDTKFRDDKTVDGKVVRQNLHWFHVVDGAGKPEKGRSCTVCHDAHGATQAHLIRPSWKMNKKEEIMMEYATTPNGGQCTACHTLKTYQRLD